MSKKELQEIINSYKWIKVKRYNEVDVTNDWELEYARLVEHHKEETLFLISKSRELAKELLNQNKETPLCTPDNCRHGY